MAKKLNTHTHTHTYIYAYLYILWGFPCGAVVKNLPANVGDARDMSSIPVSGRSPGVGNSNPLQGSGLKNSMDGGAWQAIGHG